MHFASFLNFISIALERRVTGARSPGPNIERRVWSGDFSNRPLPRSVQNSQMGDYKRKPDMILLEKLPLDDVSWTSPKVVGEFTKTSFARSRTLKHTINTKAYLLLCSQPWRRYAIVISFANWQLRVHLYDRAGAITSRPYHFHKNYNEVVHILGTLTLGNRHFLSFDPTIQISSPLKSNTHADIGWVEGSRPGRRFKIKAILWSSASFIGRGTVCYHVSEEQANGQVEEYVLKDYWVAEDALEHEVEILQEIKGLVEEHGAQGLPEFVDAWTVQFDGTSDFTDRNRTGLTSKQRPPRLVNRMHKRILMKPVAIPITHFSSLKEFVSGFIDIVCGMQNDRFITFQLTFTQSMNSSSKTGFYIAI